MKTNSLALATALTLIAFTPAFAQTEPDLTGVDPACIMQGADGTKTVDMTKCVDGKTMGAASTTTEQPAASTTTTTEQPAASTTTTTDLPTTTSSTSTAAELIVPLDQLNSAKVMSASDYIGKRVYDTAGNDIGEVNDLIISEDGSISATILGVGGFLGMGEKNVAVPVRSVEMVKDGEGWKLTVNATKEQLEKAPSYDAVSRRYAS